MKEFDKLITVIKKLRSPKGCPWDRAQTVGTMKKYLLEESYELMEAIDEGNPEAVREELGDIFLIVSVISQMYSEKGKFTLSDVLLGISEKLIVRHPHVFSSLKLKNKKEVLKYWIAQKAKKKQRKTLKDRLPCAMPALSLSEVFFKESAHLDIKAKSKSWFSSDIAALFAKLKASSSNASCVFADIIFEICAQAAKKGIDCEGALRKKILSEAENISYAKKAKSKRKV